MKKVFRERGDSLRQTPLRNRVRRGPSIFLGFSMLSVTMTLAGGAYWGTGEKAGENWKNKSRGHSFDVFAGKAKGPVAGQTRDDFSPDDMGSMFALG